MDSDDTLYYDSESDDEQYLRRAGTTTNHVYWTNTHTRGGLSNMAALEAAQATQMPCSVLIASRDIAPRERIVWQTFRLLDTGTVFE